MELLGLLSGCHPHLTRPRTTLAAAVPWLEALEVAAWPRLLLEQMPLALAEEAAEAVAPKWASGSRAEEQDQPPERAPVGVPSWRGCGAAFGSGAGSVLSVSSGGTRVISCLLGTEAGVLGRMRPPREARGTGQS